MTQRLIFQHKYKSFGCANDVNLSFSDRLLMCKNTILIYYQHISYDLTISPRSQLYSNAILKNGFSWILEVSEELELEKKGEN